MPVLPATCSYEPDAAKHLVGGRFLLLSGDLKKKKKSWNLPFSENPHALDFDTFWKMLEASGRVLQVTKFHSLEALPGHTPSSGCLMLSLGTGSCLVPFE